MRPECPLAGSSAMRRGKAGRRPRCRRQHRLCESRRDSELTLATRSSRTSPRGRIFSLSVQDALSLAAFSEVESTKVFHPKPDDLSVLLGGKVGEFSGPLRDHPWADRQVRGWVVDPGWLVLPSSARSSLCTATAGVSLASMWPPGVSQTSRYQRRFVESGTICSWGSRILGGSPACSLCLPSRL